MKIITLYRPVGLTELELIAHSGWKKFPPRLEWQPIFYPVLNQEYATQIALKWNTKDAFSGHCGIVLSFDVQEERYNKYEVQNVGGVIHNELWIPAEELEDFNNSIAGNIRILQVFFGDDFILPTDKELAETLLKFKNNDLQ